MVFKLNFSRADLENVLEGFEFPKEFYLGASTAGFQVEGGFNGPNDPKNNWYWAEVRGEKERTGPCCRFMEKYPEDSDRAAWIGLNAFRLGVEWARLQPGIDPENTCPPPFSKSAAREYARIIAAIDDRGMFPAVTLHHFTHPLWAGQDFWLDRNKVYEHFPPYIAFAAREINRFLIEEFRKEPIPYFITINEPWILPDCSYLHDDYPRGNAEVSWQNALRCYENLLIAHVLAYRIVHRIYRENGWRRPTVTTNAWCAAIYGWDRMAQDLFLAKQNGIARSEMPKYLEAQRKRFNSLIRAVPHLRGPHLVKRIIDFYKDWKFRSEAGPEFLGDLADLIYSGDEPRLLDAVGLDFYDPFPANNVEICGLPKPIRHRSDPWEWNINPGVLGYFLESYSWNACDLSIHILENGMSYRGVGNLGWPREDKTKRDEALKAFFFEMIKAIRKGINLKAYFYWSLIDNYEWGSFEPRFGLFGLDYADKARRLKTDIAGNNAAGAYHLFAKAFKTRDKNALFNAFESKVYPIVRE